MNKMNKCTIGGSRIVNCVALVFGFLTIKEPFQVLADEFPYLLDIL